MTTATRTPFVSTRFGTAVVEVDAGEKLYVRLRSGWRFWLRAEKCVRDVPQPSWYVGPDLRDVAGCLL